MTRLICLAILFVCAPWTAVGQNAGLPAAVLERLDDLYGETRSVSGDFTQEKHLAMFARPLVSRGTFAIARPGKIHWSYEEPVSLGFASDGTTVRRWDERSGAAQAKPLAGDPVLSVIVDQMLAWSTMDVPAMERHFSISLASSDPVVLHLEPNTDRLAEIISHVIIAFAPDETHVQEVTVVEPDQDKTVIRFANVRLNLELPGALF